jgi:hypothetical protein
MKTCGQCLHFQSSSYEPKQGAGMCGYLATWYAKHRKAGTYPKRSEIEEAYKTIGGKSGESTAICRPDSERDKCQRFEEGSGDLLRQA